MDYKKLIKFMRNYEDTEKLEDFAVLKDLCGDAADAIETLLAEREAAGWISVEGNPPAAGETKPTKMKFVLNGCDIFFIAEAPSDITLEQLIKQTDKIKPDWCACGICSLSAAEFSEDHEPEIIIDYDNIRKASDDVSCTIR